MLCLHRREFGRCLGERLILFCGLLETKREGDLCRQEIGVRHAMVVLHRDVEVRLVLLPRHLDTRGLGSNPGFVLVKHGTLGNRHRLKRGDGRQWGTGRASAQRLRRKSDSHRILCDRGARQPRRHRRARHARVARPLEYGVQLCSRGDASFGEHVRRFREPRRFYARLEHVLLCAERRAVTDFRQPNHLGKDTSGSVGDLEGAVEICEFVVRRLHVAHHTQPRDRECRAHGLGVQRGGPGSQGALSGERDGLLHANHQHREVVVGQAWLRDRDGDEAGHEVWIGTRACGCDARTRCRRAVTRRA